MITEGNIVAVKDPRDLMFGGLPLNERPKTYKGQYIEVEKVVNFGNKKYIQTHIDDKLAFIQVEVVTPISN